MPSPIAFASSPSASLPEFVYGELRKAILNGMFAPGQMLRQEEVAAKMGVSRSPVREALPRLEAEGIVVLHPRRGYAVAEVHPEEIKEVFELRVLLESQIAVQAIAKRTEADIAQVYSLADRMRQISESSTDDQALAHWSDLNLSFHNALLAPANMPHYMRSFATARGVIEAYIRTEVRLTGDIHQAQLEHAQLAQAFVKGDVNEFIELTREHSYHTRDRLLAGIKR
ncbi:GntR family transcriptional regulator [Comamonas testosteroni]|uniref:GntR family transcriptional regulator n=1 Tax=Comamonas testosteroni TaxID=285 RepID=UPI003899D75B